MKSFFHSTRGIGLAACALMMLASVSPAVSASAIPAQPKEFGEFVMDKANLITPEDEELMEGMVALLNEKDLGQIAVITLPAAEKNLKDHAAEILDAWSLGVKEKEQGVLVLVDAQKVQEKAEHGRIYIATETNVADRLPDGTLQKILEGNVIPAFNEGKPSKGITDAVVVIGAILEGDEKVTEQYAEDTNWFTILFGFGMAGFVLWSIFGRKKKDGDEQDSGDDWDVDTDSGDNGGGAGD